MKKNSFENENVVAIGGSLYVKTPDALQPLLEKLRSAGYSIDNLREAEYRARDGVSVETMEKNGWSLWFAKIDVLRAKCDACSGLISTIGIRTHLHKCELCGAVVYRDIIDGSLVRFSFIQKDDINSGFADIKMEAHHWDIDEGFIYFYPEVLDGLWLSGKQAKKYFEDNTDKWKAVNRNGELLIRMKYTQPFDYNVSAINPSDSCGKWWGHKIVKVYDGKEYDEYGDDFPLNDMISIYEAWRWAPLAPSPKLHERILSAAGMVSDCGYYYQDGRQAFYPVNLANMRLFVEHFTTLNIGAWDSWIANAPLSGPGMIKAIARFCHENAEVVDRPNIGNVLVGISKALSGDTLKDGERDALVSGLQDNEVANQFKSIFDRG